MCMRAHLVCRRLTRLSPRHCSVSEKPAFREACISQYVTYHDVYRYRYVYQSGLNRVPSVQARLQSTDVCLFHVEIHDMFVCWSRLKIETEKWVQDIKNETFTIDDMPQVQYVSRYVCSFVRTCTVSRYVCSLVRT